MSAETLRSSAFVSAQEPSSSTSVSSRELLPVLARNITPFTLGPSQDCIGEPLPFKAPFEQSCKAMHQAGKSCTVLRRLSEELQPKRQPGRGSRATGKSQGKRSSLVRRLWKRGSRAWKSFRCQGASPAKLAVCSQALVARMSLQLIWLDSRRLLMHRKCLAEGSPPRLDDQSLPCHRRAWGLPRHRPRWHRTRRQQLALQPIL